MPNIRVPGDVTPIPTHITSYRRDKMREEMREEMRLAVAAITPESADVHSVINFSDGTRIEWGTETGTAWDAAIYSGPDDDEPREDSGQTTAGLVHFISTHADWRPGAIDWADSGEDHADGTRLEWEPADDVIGAWQGVHLGADEECEPGDTLIYDVIDSNSGETEAELLTWIDSRQPPAASVDRAATQAYRTGKPG